MEQPEPTLWYVEAGKPVVIGYATNPDVTPTVHQLNNAGEPPVQVTSEVTKVGGKKESLYWITIAQAKGAVWYEWVHPATGETVKILIFADDETDTYVSRHEDSARIKRLQLIWRLMFRTGMPQEVVDRVLEGVGNKLSLATHAFKLAADILNGHGGDITGTRSDLRKLDSDADPAQIRTVVAGAGISADAETAATIVRGALLVVGRHEN